MTITLHITPWMWHFAAGFIVGGLVGFFAGVYFIGRNFGSGYL